MPDTNKTRLKYIPSPGESIVPNLHKTLSYKIILLAIAATDLFYLNTKNSFRSTSCLTYLNSLQRCTLFKTVSSIIQTIFFLLTFSTYKCFELDHVTTANIMVKA